MLSLIRSSCPDVFCKKGVLRNFAKFTGKLCQSLFFNKVTGLKLFERLLYVQLTSSVQGRVQSFLRIWSHLPEKSLMENFAFLCSASNYKLKVSNKIIVRTSVESQHVIYTPNQQNKTFQSRKLSGNGWEEIKSWWHWNSLKLKLLNLKQCVNVA